VGMCIRCQRNVTDSRVHCGQRIPGSRGIRCQCLCSLCICIQIARHGLQHVVHFGRGVPRMRPVIVEITVSGIPPLAPSVFITPSVQKPFTFHGRLRCKGHEVLVKPRANIVLGVIPQFFRQYEPAEMVYGDNEKMTDKNQGDRQ